MTGTQLKFTDQEVETPLSRSKDPLSSSLAEEKVKRSGKTKADRIRALKAVREHPGNTARELAGYTGLDRYMLSRRLPELEKNRYVFRAVCPSDPDKYLIRKCRVGGNMSTVWYALDALEDE